MKLTDENILELINDYFNTNYKDLDDITRQDFIKLLVAIIVASQ